MPFVFLAVLLTWTRVYGTGQKKKGERMVSAAPTR